MFVERVLPGSVIRKLTDEEMAAYRAPFVEAGESRRPTLTWPREIPLRRRAAGCGGYRGRLFVLAREGLTCPSCSSTPSLAPS